MRARRSFLTACAASLGASAWATTGAPGRDAGFPGDWSFEDFLEHAVPEARRLRKELGDAGTAGSEDRYLLALAALAVRLREVPEPELRPSSQGEGVRIGANWAGDPFIVLHWKLEPGARIRPHAHTYGNVVTLGLTGSAVVTNYETVEPADYASDEPAILRRTHEQYLQAGRVNLVPLAHDFVHGFAAGPEGASGLDITTRLRDRQPTPYLELDPEPVDLAQHLVRGSWSLE